MDLIYNSDNFAILAYAGQGLELMDKNAHSSLFMPGVHANCFFNELDSIPEVDRTEENVDEFLVNYSKGQTTPMLVH